MTNDDPAHKGDTTGERPDADLGVLLDDVVADAKGWLEARKEVMILEAGERVGRVSGAMVSNLILAALLGTALLMASLALGFWSGKLLGDMGYGFLLVAAFYLLVALLFSLFGSKQIRAIITLHMINATRDEEKSV